MKREEGFYYIQHPAETEPTLVYGYQCSDLDGEFCFGFNTYDGGGLLPALDLADGTVVIPVEIKVKTDD